MALSDITAAAVQMAVTEYDLLGQDKFLTKYGFKKARSYLLQHDGREYDSKAVLGAAHGLLPGNTPLTSDMFSGGKDAAAGELRRLGSTFLNPAGTHHGIVTKSSWHWTFI